MNEIKQAYEIAKNRYEELGVDTDKALARMETVPVSFNAWQFDDVMGFMNKSQAMTGGILSTGNYIGVAKNAEQLRQDADFAFSFIPGKKKLSLQATQVDTTEHIDLDEIEPRHYKAYVDWAKERGIGLDFNPSCYSHPKSSSGFTLASADKGIRDFWIEHCIRSSKVGEYFGKELKQQAVTNLWICDGYKDTPADMYAPRERLAESLDKVFEHPVDQKLNLDTLESKLFGIGVEAYTVGSHEFYMMYAAKRNRALCLDAGHFHPTEEVAKKISAVMLFADEMALHVTRPMRWDSDHVVSFDDNLQAMMDEVVRNQWLTRIHIGTDYFDASINRITACVIGMRNTQKALLKAMLEPTDTLRRLEMEGNYSERFALMEELKTYPFEAVWDYFCEKQGVPVGIGWMKQVKQYERDVLPLRK
jgi:L-rhamnose isomerase